MTADPALRRATYADLERVPPHMVAEIVDGVLETHPRPRFRHGAAAARLNAKLGNPFDFGDGGPGGWLFIIETELRLGGDTIVPDLAGWRRERLPSEPETSYGEIAPDWVCEILSPATARLDRGPKRRIYAAAGVSFLWLLDPMARELECFALAGGQWLLQTTLQSGDEIRVEPFDAVGFPLDALFPFDTPVTPQKPSEEA